VTWVNQRAPHLVSNTARSAQHEAISPPVTRPFPKTEGMTHMMPNHVLRVGQTIRLDSAQEMAHQHPSFMEPGNNHSDPELDVSLDNLNRLIMELDPTFEPIQLNKSPSCVSPPTGTTRPQSCAAFGPLFVNTQFKLLCRTSPSHGGVTQTVSSSSLHSNLSLASEDADCPESILTCMSGSFSDGSSRTRSCDNRPSLTKQGHLQELPGKGAQSSPASLSGSWSDIPVLLVNGAPQPNPHIPSLGPEMDLMEIVSVSNSRPSGSDHIYDYATTLTCYYGRAGSQARFNGCQPSMKFVMDTSKFWFRPHITEALVKDKEAGTFVVRDSTSYRGSFGLAMKVDPTSTNQPEQRGSEPVRHFLIESSAKGVRIKGSAQEPYFGSLSALVYQHTISAYALPCRLLLLHSQGRPVVSSTCTQTVSWFVFFKAGNFVYLNAVPTEMLTGPCAVQRAVSSTLEKASGSFIPTLVNLKVSLKGVTLTDINRKLFFRRHYPAHLLSHGGVDPDNRVWVKGCGFSARLFGFVAKGVEASVENVCHVFAEYDPLQPYSKVIEVIQAHADTEQL
uniref:SH2 domain-containing protein n=1 Tax=Mola mola TaxID=94237 RepID=A0A3Q3WGJ6_MOLML